MRFTLPTNSGAISNVELTILADELSSYDFVTDEKGKTIAANELPELPGI